MRTAFVSTSPPSAAGLLRTVRLAAPRPSSESSPPAVDSSIFTFTALARRHGAASRVPSSAACGVRIGCHDLPPRLSGPRGPWPAGRGWVADAHQFGVAVHAAPGRSLAGAPCGPLSRRMPRLLDQMVDSSFRFSNVLRREAVAFLIGVLGAEDAELVTPSGGDDVLTSNISATSPIE